MPLSIAFGPLAVPSAWLVLLVAVGAGFLGARYPGRALAAAIRPALGRLLLVALLASRLAFVWQYRSGYFDAPLDVLDLRDGGWEPQAGVVAAWLYGLFLGRTRPALRRPLVAGLAAASVVWLAGSLALAWQASADTRLQAGSLPTLEGGQASLADFAGKPAVVNLWATWCPPCRREMPLLQQAQAEHPDVHFVFLNQGESAAQVQGFIAGRAPGLRNVILDPKGRAGAEFGTGALPTTLFFDSQGRLVARHLGELSRATLAQRLEKLAPTGRP